MVGDGIARGIVSKSSSRLWSDMSVGNTGEKETFFFMRSGAGLFGVIVVVSVDCVDCIDAIDDSENVRLCLGFLSSSALSKE